MRSAKRRRFAVALKLYGISIGSMFFQDDCISRYLFGSYVPDGICICSLRATRYLYYCPLDYFTFTRISGPSSRQVHFYCRTIIAHLVFLHQKKHTLCKGNYPQFIFRIVRWTGRISAKRDLNATKLTTIPK